MLRLLKIKQKKIASITLTLFVGSWLLLLCQSCLGSMHETQQRNHAVADKTMSCHESAPVDHKDNASHKHCLGVCDCHAMTITMSNDKAADLVQKIKYIPDLFLYTELQQPVLSYREPPTSRIFSPPERAILLPLQSYNVLLI